MSLGSFTWKLFRGLTLLILVMGVSMSSVSLLNSKSSYFSDLSTNFPWVNRYVFGFALLIASAVVIERQGSYRLRTILFGGRERVPVLHIAVVGICFGIFMTLVDFLPVIYNGGLRLDYDPSLINLLGRMGYVWILVGVSEEFLFRGLIQNSICYEPDPQVNLLLFKTARSNVISSLLYGLSHFVNFLSKPVSFVLPQVLYTILFGLALGHFYIKSGRLVEPIIIHNLADGLEYTLEYLMYLVMT
jgi:membrane protease YdiL (CAAX protease family)